MGREVRMVPADYVHPVYSEEETWEHPRLRGRFKPLFYATPEKFAETVAQYKLQKAQWKKGYTLDWVSGDFVPKSVEESCATFSEWYGEPPQASDYMLIPKEQQTHYMMFETVTEGTPISPVFPTAEALAKWLAETGANAGAYSTATYEQWLNVCKGGYAPSMIIANGKIMSGVEATTGLQ